METSQTILYNGLAFLAFATGIIFIIIAYVLIRLLVDLSKLTKNLDETTTIVKSELKPTLSELNKTLASINSIAQNADRQVNSFSKLFEGALGTGTFAFLKAKKFSSEMVRNIAKGFLTFCKTRIKR